MTTSIFISYSQESTAHGERVLALANRLRAQGIEARIDQYFPHPPEGWPRWRRRQFDECDFVLLVCTPTLKRQYDRDEPGAFHSTEWEAMYADLHVYEAGGFNDKIIPVLFEEGTTRDIPLLLRSFTPYRLPRDYDDLYRRLTNQPKAVPPPIGKVQPMPSAPLIGAGVAVDRIAPAAAIPGAEKLSLASHAKSPRLDEHRYSVVVELYGRIAEMLRGLRPVLSKMLNAVETELRSVLGVEASPCTEEQPLLCNYGIPPDDSTHDAR